MLNNTLALVLRTMRFNTVTFFLNGSRDMIMKLEGLNCKHEGIGNQFVVKALFMTL